MRRKAPTGKQEKQPREILAQSRKDREGRGFTTEATKNTKEEKRRPKKLRLSFVPSVFSVVNYFSMPKKSNSTARYTARLKSGSQQRSKSPGAIQRARWNS